VQQSTGRLPICGLQDRAGHIILAGHPQKEPRNVDPSRIP
jgi:hypothetical protein